MRKRQTFPVIVMRWFKRGQDVAFHPHAEIHCSAVFRALSEVKSRPETVPFEASVDRAQLIGEIRPDPMCPDDRGRHRNPYVAVLAVVDKKLTVQEKESLLDELRSLEIPEEPGPKSDLTVSFEDRWAILRTMTAPVRGSGWPKLFPVSRSESPALVGDEQLRELCRRAELELFDASRRGLAAFKSLCLQDCLLTTSNKCLQTNEPNVTVADIQRHSFNIDDRDWQIDVRLLSDYVVLSALRHSQGRSDHLVHQFVQTSRPNALVLMRSDRWEGVRESPAF